MTVLAISAIFLLLYTGCLCHPLGVSHTYPKNESFIKENNVKKGTIRISGPWHSDSALDRNIDPGEDSYVKKVISSNEGINFNKDMAEAGEMFDVNGIEDFYDKNAMVTYELNGHEIPVHLKQKYTPQTKSLFPEYNRDSPATAGAMTKSPPETYQTNTGLNCLTVATCSTATTDNSAESKANVAQQIKGDKNLLAIRNLLQLHSNQYGENHGHIPLPQKVLDSNQEKENNKALLEKAYENVKLPWKFSVSSGHVDLNDDNKGPKFEERGNELFNKFSNAISPAHGLNDEIKSPRLDDRGNELFNKFQNANLMDENHRLPLGTSTEIHPGIPESSASESHRGPEDNSGTLQSLRNSESKVSDYTKVHSGAISNLPSLDDIHSIEKSHDEMMKQFTQNNLLSSKDAEVANILKKLPTQLLNVKNRENDLEPSKSVEPSRDMPDLVKSPTAIANAYQRGNNLDPSHDMARLLNMKINSFIKPADHNGLLPSADSNGALDKPSVNGPPSGSTKLETSDDNNNLNSIDDSENGKAKVRILSLLGELTDKLKGVEAVVSAQHKAEQGGNNDENSVMSKLQTPEKSESSLTSENPEQEHHPFSDSASNSYKPLSLLSKFQQNLPEKGADPHNALEANDDRSFSKEPDVKPFWSSRDSDAANLGKIDGHIHQSLFDSNNHDSSSHEDQLSVHDFPHNDLHEDGFHHDAHDNDLDMNSHHIVSGTTSQQPSGESLGDQTSKLSHDSQEAGMANGSPADEHHSFGQFDSRIEGEFHGKIPDVDFKEAHKDIFSPSNDEKIDGHGDPHGDYGKFTDDTSSTSRQAMSDTEIAADKDKDKLPPDQIQKLKDQERLIPEQIQKLKDQNKPFIMNTAAIDYQPKDQKEDEIEGDRSLANITPDFKPYDDSSNDDERGRISKYRHQLNHKLEGFDNDHTHGKSDVHKEVPEDTAKSDMKPVINGQGDSRSYHYNERKYKKPDDRNDHDKAYQEEGRTRVENKEHIQSDKIKEYTHFERDRESKQADKAKETDDREGYTLSDKNGESIHSDKTKELDDRGGYSRFDKHRELGDRDYTEAEKSKTQDDRDYLPPSKSTGPGDRDYHQRGNSNEPDDRRYIHSDRDRDSGYRDYAQSDQIKMPNDRGYVNSEKSREFGDRDYARSEKTKGYDEREYFHSENAREGENKDYLRSDKFKDSGAKDYEHATKDKESDDRGKIHSDQTKEPIDGKYSTADKFIESVDNEAADSHGREQEMSSKKKDTDEIHDRQAIRQDLQEKETSHSDNGRETPETRNEKTDKHDEPDKTMISDKDKESQDPWYRNNAHEKEDKVQPKEPKYEKENNEKYISGKLTEHEVGEHEKKVDDNEKYTSGKPTEHEEGGHEKKLDNNEKFISSKLTERDEGEHEKKIDDNEKYISSKPTEHEEGEHEKKIDDKEKYTSSKLTEHEEGEHGKKDEDNEKFISSKITEHNEGEHGKTATPENSKHENDVPDEAKDKKLLLESLGNGDGDHQDPSFSKLKDAVTTPQTDHASSSISEDHHSSEVKNEHDEDTMNKENKGTQIVEDGMKHKPTDDSSNGHQLGKDRERTFTPKTKYIDDAEYPDYNEVKDAALFETNFVRKQFHAKKVSWSDRLSDKAQQVAERVAKTIVDNNKIDQYKHPGENIALVRLDAPNVGKEAVDLWSKESKAYDFKSPSVTKKNSDFVQLAWKANNEFGMGVSKSKAGNGWIVTAFYDTPYIDRFQDLRSNLQPDNPVEDPYGDIAG